MIETLVKWFGQEAKNFQDYMEKDWNQGNFTLEYSDEQTSGPEDVQLEQFALVTLQVILEHTTENLSKEYSLQERSMLQNSLDSWKGVRYSFYSITRSYSKWRTSCRRNYRRSQSRKSGIS